MELTTQTLVESLRSDVCPICRGHKRPRQTMCPADYRRLSAATKRALYNTIWDGYDEAVKAAMRELGAREFHLKPAPARAGKD